MRRWVAGEGDGWSAVKEAEDTRLLHVYNDGITRAKPPMVLIARLPATTAAGIYAKALVVRASKTGAAKLAMSLAEDLAANHALRAALWGLDPEPAGNVVALAARERDTA